MDKTEERTRNEVELDRHTVGDDPGLEEKDFIVKG